MFARGNRLGNPQLLRSSGRNSGQPTSVTQWRRRNEWVGREFASYFAWGKKLMYTVRILVIELDDVAPVIFTISAMFYTQLTQPFVSVRFI
ncbi:hypothetical protein Hamer_G006941, partial [Homarus americanus]